MGMGTNKAKRYLIAAVITVMLLAVLLVIGIFRFSDRSQSPDDGLMEQDLVRLSQAQYDSVFFSMHSTRDFSVEDFLFYCGTNTLIGDHALLSLNELGQYLDGIFASGNDLTHVFLALDPFQIWDTCGQQEENWTAEFYQNLYLYMEDYPGVSFEILLPYPSLNYWLENSEQQTDTILSTYRTFISDVSIYENAATYFFAHEYWLIGNPANYSDSFFDANSVISRKIYLYAFCNHQNQISPANSDLLFDSLRDLVERERNTPTHYPDLSGLWLVFFGDSIIANASGSYSIPGYVNGLSGAAVYSCARGGTQASTTLKSDQNFPDVIDDFLDTYCVEKDGCYEFCPEETEVPQDSLYFIINFGLNDYFVGAPLDNPEDPYDTATYAGGLRTSIAALRQALPQSHFVILTPPFTSYFGYGTDVQSENGGTLADYAAKAAQVAAELDLYCLDNFNELGIDASTVDAYTLDGVHPNEEGRLLMATHLMYYLERILTQ